MRKLHNKYTVLSVTLCTIYDVSRGRGPAHCVSSRWAGRGGMKVATPRNKSFPEPTATSVPAKDYTGCIHIMSRNVRKCEQLHYHQIFLCTILKELTNTPRQQNNTSCIGVSTRQRPCDLARQTTNQMTSYSDVERRQISWLRVQT